MFVMLSCYNLFMREVSKKKLLRLVELAHKDPHPLLKAVQVGYFNSIKFTAIQLLEEEMGKIKHDNIRKNFKAVIDMLNNQL